MTNNTDKKIRDLLVNHETPLGSNVSFEKVMAMRGTKESPIWWKPTIMAFATLGILSVAGFYYFGNTNSTTNTTGFNQQTITNNSSTNSSNGLSKPGSTALNNENIANGHSKELITGNNQPAQQLSSKSVAGSNPVTTNPKVNSNGQINNGGTSEGKTSITQNGGSEKTVETRRFPVFNIGSFGLHTAFAFFSTDVQWLDFNFKFKHKHHRPQPVVRPRIEIMGMTGSLQKSTFGPGEFTVRGNHHFANYNALALWDLKRGRQIGVGIGYSEYAGSGDWMKLTPTQKTTITSHQVTIVQPGLPNQTITVYDTTTSTVNTTTTGELSYRFNKISIPIGFRMHFGQGTTLLRVSGTLSPGILLSASGNNFKSNAVSNLDGQKSRALTLDARIGVGVYYQMGKRIAAIVEPSAVWQGVNSSYWKGYNRLGAGLSLGLVIKPW